MPPAARNARRGAGGIRFLLPAILAACAALAGPPGGAGAQPPGGKEEGAPSRGRSMSEMFKGIPVDRCKEIGGPPAASPGAPTIEHLSVREGSRGREVTIRASGFEPKRGDEVHFLLRGKDIRSPAEPGAENGIRARIPDFGVREPSRGWVYVSRGGAPGKAVPFLFLPGDASVTPGTP